MTAAERAAVDQAMRAASLDLGSDFAIERPQLPAMLGAVPPPTDVTSNRARTGGVDTVEIDVVVYG